MTHVKAFSGRWYDQLESDAFAYDTLAADQTSSDPSESFLPMESILPADSPDTSDFRDDVTITETVPYFGDGTSNTIVFAERYAIESDWILA